MENFLPGTSERVPSSTGSDVNERIHNETIKRLDEIGHDHGRISERLEEIEREWDIERTLEANAAAVALAGLALGATVSRRFFAIPVVVAGFLFQHAVQGWCPPLPVFRRLGVRTQREIDRERTVLLARKGGLKDLETLEADEALGVLKH